MKNLKFLIIIFPLVAASCAKNIQMSYPAQSISAGTIVLKPGKSTEKTSLLIDSNLIVVEKNVRSVTINNVPAGTHDIYFKATTTWYKKNVDIHIPVDVENGQKVKKRVDVPFNNWVWAKIGTDIALGALLRSLVK